ncbi:MAG: SDR family NAD(P)-dependent oxidoreductase [Alphaproteobacteria bacterium]|nr:SDR family NAD(P)-dependent oxidoreductase [Alphaproteobacteria bacterium]
MLSPSPSPSSFPAHILITGASSGIGEALVLEYAGPGVRLTLLGRNEDRLEAVAAAAAAQGATVDRHLADVTDPDRMAAVMQEADARQPVDLVFANAGISAGTGGGDGGAEPAGQVRQVMRVNVDGVLNTVLPAVELMVPRQRGQIAIISSLAGFRGIPGAPAYCASKAAVMVYGEALRGQLHASGIAVNVINPGYVRSPMTDRNDFPMPFLMDADKAARIIRRGLDRNKPRIAFPWPMVAAVRLLQALPPAWTDPLLRRLPKKGGGVD